MSIRDDTDASRSRLFLVESLEDGPTRLGLEEEGYSDGEEDKGENDGWAREGVEVG